MENNVTRVNVGRTISLHKYESNEYRAVRGISSVVVFKLEKSVTHKK